MATAASTGTHGMRGPARSAHPFDSAAIRPNKKGGAHCLGYSEDTA